MQSDNQLIDQINKGDLDAFEILYHRYCDWVHRLAYRFTRDEEMAQDVVQDVFIYFLKKFPGFELTAKMTTFLYPTVKFTSLQRIRQRRRESQTEDYELISIPAPEEPTSSREELAKAMSVLPAEQRDVILMRYLDGFTFEEIGSILDIPAGTVKSRIHRALKTLRENKDTRQYFLE